jgi:hypothetical protein
MRPNFTFRKIFLLLLFSFLIFNSSFLIGTVRYVSKTGLSIPPYNSWENAADSIQKCINICVFGDTIYVANGIYQEQVVMIDGLSLIGAGTDSCIVDSRNFPPQGLHTVEVADSCLIKGFYIRTSNDFNYGYGIYTIGQNGLITENKFSNANTGIYLYGTRIMAYENYFFNIRRGITVANSNSIIRQNEIYPITQPGASGIFITAFSSSYSPTIDSNHITVRSGKGIYKELSVSALIKSNVIQFVQYGAEGIFLSTGDSSKIYNNSILIGTGQEGISNHGVPNLQVINNYIKGGSANSPLGMYVWSPNTIKNNVVSNTVTGIAAGETQNLVVQYNDLWNNEINYTNLTPDSTNLSVDPMIVSDDTTQGELDFHLQMFSPLVDAGDPNILDKDSTRSDIGLYGGPYGESYIYVDFPPRPPVNLTANVADSTVTLTWNKNTEADFSYYNLYCDTVMNFQIDSSKLVASIADTFYYYIIPIGAESLYFKLTAVDNQSNESNPSEEVAVILVSVIDEWVPVNNYILYQNYPNPFNPNTIIGYKLKERGYVKLYVYSVTGELVSVLVNQVQESGYYEVEFNARFSHSGEIRNLASGVYIFQIIVTGENNTPVFSDIKKMVYIK